MTWKGGTTMFRGLTLGAAIIALLWVLRPLPQVLRERWTVIRRSAPVIKELNERIPPSRANELKGVEPVLHRINRFISRRQPLLYVGEMRYGIRLRYYTMPREALWYYVYDADDLRRLPDFMATNRFSWVLMQDQGAGRIPTPDAWKLMYEKERSPFRLYRVKHDH